jgi:hypothetical protein
MSIRETVRISVVAIICIATTSFALSRFAFLIQHLLRVHYDWRFEFFMVTGQLLFQLPFLLKYPLVLKLDYFINMLLVSFLGSILLMPLLIINHFTDISDVFNLCYFFGVVAFMFLVHKHRVKVLALPFYISYTWVLYRVIILLFII